MLRIYFYQFKKVTNLCVKINYTFEKGNKHIYVRKNGSIIYYRSFIIIYQNVFVFTH